MSDIAEPAAIGFVMPTADDGSLLGMEPGIADGATLCPEDEPIRGGIILPNGLAPLPAPVSELE